MNRTYALVWNPSLAAWTVTDERARRRGKGAGAVLAAALLLPLTAIAADLPSGGQVVAGSGAINQPNANQMVIDQASNKLAIDWQSFDIAAGNKVTFNQPGRDAIALNRVLGADGSKIMGQLDANGRVFLINPNGVLFGAGAQVNVGGLVASTLNISDSDFAAGNYKFKGDGSNASVTNKGHISAADGGSIALLGGTVSNNGVIVANQGTVALAAGNAVTLDFAGDGLLNVQVDEAVVDALVENHQLIKADGGQVLLTANAGDALLKTVVNNTGVIEAHTLGEKDGKIVLLGSFDGGAVQVAGTLDASAPNGGDGGFIETSGAHVKVANGAKVTTKATNGKTGTWLIDPSDFTIAASGGDMTGAALSTAVQNNNVEIMSTDGGITDGNGDIHVNDAVTWNSANTLTLNAERNININAAITASDAGGKVALKYGQASTNGAGADYHIKAPINLQSGSNFSTQKGSTGSVVTYTVVNNAATLQAMNSNLAGNYAVGSNIDLSSISNWVTVGEGGSSFTGQFAGLGHTLSNLTIDLSGTTDVGLFGYTERDSVIRDIGLVGGSVSGLDFVGGLVGDNGGTISNAYATGNVTGSGYAVGGLVGHNNGTISNAYATGNVTGSSNVGGLVGYNDGGNISNAYATGSVSGSVNYVGGLVGVNTNSGTISNAYATGSVSGTGSGVGGLVGTNSQSTISNAYATGSVLGSNAVGGLVGFNYLGTINSSFYATTDAAGSVINNSGATTGAFSGNNLGTGKIWAQLSASATFAAWDQSIWSFPGVDTSVAGYGLGGLPYLTGVTRQADIVRSTLFAGGFGTQDSAYTITSWQQLANINRVLNGGYYFSLSNNLDQNSLGYTTLASATANGGAGWNPLGNDSSPFTGTFDGLSHTINDLVINRSSTNYVGLFGATGSNSVIRDIGLVGGNVTGKYWVGGLVGQSKGTISNAYASGSVDGAIGVGGLVGSQSDGSISNAYASGSVTGSIGDIGGLVGRQMEGRISNSYASSIVNATGETRYVGGLVGDARGTISNAYATGSVKGSSQVGGLVGINNNGSISNAYATGSVEGSSQVGGLVGQNNGRFSNSFYATTDRNGSTINNGGATTTDVYNGNAYGASKTWAELTKASTFTDWSIASTGGSSATWRIYDGYSGPLLRSFLQSVTLTADASGGSKTYNGTAATGTTTYTESSLGSDLDTSKLMGTLGYTSNSKNAGTYSSTDGSLILSGLYSGQQGYDISYAETSLTIAQKALTVSGMTAGSKVYDGTTSATLSGGSLSGLVSGETLALSSMTGTFSDKNAGTGKTVTVSGATLADGTGLASNYTINNPTDLTADITQKALTITGLSASDKVYDGNTGAVLGGGTLSGLITGETLVLNGMTGTFSDKNAGTGKTVTVSGATLADGTGLASNYTVAQPVAVTANIDKAALTITANSGQVTYNGQQQNIAGFTASGLVNGETASVLNGVSTTGGSGTNAGSYSHSASGTDGNYELTFVDGGLTIDKAALTITALDASKTAGQSIALSGYSASGLVGGDSINAVSLSSLGQPTTAAAGNYAIVASDAIGAALSNYAISYQDGSLLVNPAPITPTTPSNQQPTANTPPYISVLASNGQSIATQAPQQARQETVSEPEAQNPQMLVTNPLADIMNLQVINQGIRLPEGI